MSRSLQGSVHEPTSFQAPLLNRAGRQEREPVLWGGSRATSTPCEVPELVQKFSKEKLVASS